MNTRFPSNSAICGLCAAFFLAASIRTAGNLLSALFLWRGSNAIADPMLWAYIPAILFYAVACAFVGIRLLCLSTHCILHGLILGWLCLAISVTFSAQSFYHLAHGSGMRHSEQWAVFLLGATVSVLFPTVVVWLLHRVRSRERGGAGPLPANLQVA